MVISGSTISEGQSACWMGGATPAWPTAYKSFSNTPGLGDVYTLTATLYAPNTTGAYSKLSLSNRDDRSTAVKAVLGYNTLYFYLLGTPNGGFSLTCPQRIVPIDVKMVVSATNVQCYYRDHGASEWISGGVIPYGNDLSNYNEVGIAGHGNYSGGIDSLQLTTNTPVQDGFEGGDPGSSVTTLPGWTGDASILISNSTISQGQSACWMGGATPAWPAAYKGFYHQPGVGDVYTLTATLYAPNTTGAYAQLSLSNSANRTKAVKAVLGYNTLYFYVLGTPTGGFVLTHPQRTVPIDIKMAISGTNADFHYRNHGTSEWISGGSIPHGNALSTYNEIGIAGHGNHPGGIDSIQFATDSLGIPISRGRQVILNRGLQIQSLVFFNNPGFSDITRWNTAKFSAINFWGAQNPAILAQLPAGTGWSRMYVPGVESSKYLTTAEMAYSGNLVSLQYDDERDDTMEPERQIELYSTYRDWNQRYPNTLAYTNFGGYPTWADPHTLVDLTKHMQIVQPDMLMFDAYPPFSFPDAGIYPYLGRNNWYTYMQIYRTAALRGYDGTGMQPIPYGQYLNLFRDNNNISGSLPSESFVRLQQFASWTFGYTYVSAFIYNTVSSESYLRSVMFSAPGDSSPTPVFDYVKDSNIQSRNLAPALIRLKSTDVRMICSKINGISRPLPSGLSTWAMGAGGSNLITSITPRGKTNVSNPPDHCDWLIGYFLPIKPDNSDYPFADGLHFMVTNGATGTPFLPGGTGDPATASAEWARIDFDFSGTTYNSLQRVNRNTGLTEVVNLTPNGPGKYYLLLHLDGGTGDLFRFHIQ